jgi:hypothetical protein
MVLGLLCFILARLHQAIPEQIVIIKTRLTLRSPVPTKVINET